MRRVVLAAAVFSAAAFAQAPGGAQKKPDSASDTAMKDMVKDAASAGSEKPRDPNAPDISKMPFTSESVQKIVGFYTPKIQDCYEETLAAKGKNPVEGKLVTDWVVTPEGLVKSARV